MSAGHITGHANRGRKKTITPELKKAMAERLASVRRKRWAKVLPADPAVAISRPQQPDATPA